MNNGLVFKNGGLKRMPLIESEVAAGASAASEETTKVCLGCGRKLPLSAFHIHNKSKDGHTKECIECTRRRSKAAVTKNAKSNPLAQFTARQLMRELKARGYEGVLEYTTVQKIDISEM